MNAENLQREYDLIFSSFKATTEPYDSLEWDGETLEVCLGDETIETYTRGDLAGLIPNINSVSD